MWRAGPGGFLVQISCNVAYAAVFVIFLFFFCFWSDDVLIREWRPTGPTVAPANAVGLSFTGFLHLNWLAGERR
jgi:hypothetical protein